MKTYLVPITDEVIKAMESGEAPSFLHCATCLDDLTNGEVILKMFPETKVEECYEDVEGNPHLYCVHGLNGVTYFTANWWNRKWGEA